MEGTLKYQKFPKGIVGAELNGAVLGKVGLGTQENSGLENPVCVTSFKVEI